MSEEPREPDERKDTGWERDLLNRLAFASLNEQRRARRWSIFFRGLLFAYLFLLLLLYLPDFRGGDGPDKKHVALIEVEGLISSASPANAEDINRALRSAYENENAAGILLQINSPGGSPVQAGLIYDEILRLREKYPGRPTYAVVTDLCASGGYYIAAAADAIYVNRASVVGSIGVLMNGFGFVEAMDKLGVERRLLTAGENKDFMDPFSPVEEDEKVHIQKILNGIHAQFIAAVKQGRGDRLKEVDGIFSGLVWTGEEAVEMGLVDELASPRQVATEIIGVDNIVSYSPKGSYLDLLLNRTGETMARLLLESGGWASLR